MAQSTSNITAAFLLLQQHTSSTTAFFFLLVLALVLGVLVVVLAALVVQQHSSKRGRFSHYYRNFVRHYLRNTRRNTMTFLVALKAITLLAPFLSPLAPCVVQAFDHTLFSDEPFPAWDESDEEDAWAKETASAKEKVGGRCHDGRCHVADDATTDPGVSLWRKRCLCGGRCHDGPGWHS